MGFQVWAIVAKRNALSIAGSFVLSASVSYPTTAQIPILPNFHLPIASPASDRSDSQIVTTWIRLDGRRLFQIAAPRANLSQRVEDIQQRLQSITENYFQSDSFDLQVEVRTENNLPLIYVNGESLITVTDLDARMQQEDPLKLAQILSESLEQSLTIAKQERQPPFLTRQSAIGAGVLLGAVFITWGVRRWQWQLKLRSIPVISPLTDPVKSQLTRQQHKNLQEVKQRLFQLAEGIIWGSGTLFVLGLFPYTRIVQFWILTALTVPFILGIVGLATYVVIRLSYVLIDQFTAALTNNNLLSPEDSARLQLRVSTISGVTKGIATLSAVLIAIFVGLATLGVDIAPLLAGAGLIGVAVSLASQNLIKDAINGFLIILEDQYAVGDVIAVGQVGGLVENINLRITQLRDSEGRLITIPNSEIKIVANLSSRWSRADLNIPVAYEADIDEVLQLIETVALEMDRDPQWEERILETPQILGIENFGDRGLMIRVWIKTQPLKQWDVAREYRRRLKISFDKHGIAIPFPQQVVWVNDAQPLPFPIDGKGVSSNPPITSDQ